MTIDEAIADLSSQAKTKDRLGYSRQADALKLLIEAGKRLELCRSKGEIYAMKLLPGETKD